MSSIQEDSDRLLSADEPPASSSSSSSPRRPSDTPYSPRPHLFDSLPLPAGPVASDVLTDADYRRMRADAFSLRNMLPPLIGSAAIAYAAPKVFKTKPQSVGIVRTGIFTVALAFTLGYTTYNHLSTVISAARSRAHHAVLPRTTDGQVLFPDSSSSIDPFPHVKPAESLSPEPLVSLPAAPPTAVQSELQKELAGLGKAKERTRWAKGRGLDNEVEEEAEMRDQYLRPGTPRREV